MTAVLQWICLILGAIIVFVVAVVVVALVVIALVAFIDRRVAPMRLQLSGTMYPQVTSEGGAINGLSSQLIIYLPGILADGDTSSEPVRAIWQKYGDVMTVSYGTEHFDGAATALAIARILHKDSSCAAYKHLTFIGSSMGGMLALDIIQHLRNMGEAERLNRSSLIMVDTPSGSQDMKAGGNIAAPLMRLLPFGRFCSRLFAPAMRAMLQPPKDENIESHLDAEYIKTTAMAAMEPYSLSIWRDQLAYMASHDAPAPQMFQGLDFVLYLKCGRNNETVTQPQAADRWREACASGDTMWVDSTHCGYLERPFVWNEVFEEALA